MEKFFGGMEGGGTKFVCAVSDDGFHLVERIQFPTSTPKKTLDFAVSFFKKYHPKSIGLSTFGPVDLNLSSRKYGFITTTPKPGWSGIDVISPFRKEFSIPLSFTLDVNAAVIGEHRFLSTNSQIKNLVYMTIGTGIGAGIICNGNLLQGLSHPEVGHMRIPHDLHLDPFPGVCPYHGDCLEGLASGPALHTRWKMSPAELPNNHPAWELESNYIAQAVVNIILTVSPQKILLGGGVMKQNELFPLIRKKVNHLLNNYVLFPEITKNIDTFITSPGLGNDSGIIGALVMAKDLFDDDK